MRKIIYSLLIFVFAFFTISATGVSAETRASQNGSITVAKNEVINDDLFIAGQTVTIDGTVNGDVFAGAQTVIVNGIINGNLHIGANSATITGTVKGNAYIGTENVSINAATIGGSLLVGSGNVNIDKASTVSGSILAGAWSVSIDSHVGRSVYIGAGSATIGADAIIAKNLYYQVGQNGNMSEINITPGAKIAGGIYKSTPQLTPAPAVTRGQAAKAFGSFSSFTKILGFLGALVVGFLYYKFFTGHFTKSAGHVSKSFWKSFGVGFLITVAAVPAFIVMAITVIGLPLVGISFLLLGIGTYLAKIVVGFALGEWIANKFKWNKLATFWIMALGLFVIYLLKIIPVIGGLTSLVVVWAGLGALTLHTFSKKT